MWKLISVLLTMEKGDEQNDEGSTRVSVEINIIKPMNSGYVCKLFVPRQSNEKLK